MMAGLKWTRRVALALPGLLMAEGALGFGQQGAFHARRLVVGGAGALPGARQSALGHWAWELVRRTSAPARLRPTDVSADDPALLNEPFCVWAGQEVVKPLTASERRNLRSYFELGGVLFVDELAPERRDFAESARRELSRVLPEVPITPLPDKHVLFKSYYLVERPVGRSLGPPRMDAMVRGRRLQVLFSDLDLLGALSRQGDSWAMPVSGSAEARQQAVRLAVNIAMYVLCSDYKDDQVHAEELMRRRGRLQPKK